MWLEEVDEILKGYLPYYVLLFLPLFIIVSPINPVSSSHEFPVYRMQHFDLHGVAHGSRSASVNLEARSLGGWSTSRHCVVMHLRDLTVDHYQHIRSKAGALLIVLPDKLHSLSAEEKNHLRVLEDVMLSQEITIPVYFLTWSPVLDTIITDISQSSASDDKTKPALQAIMASVSANGYQIVISPKTPSPKHDVKVATIQGVLVGQGHDGKNPTIAIVAHYDSFGVVPELSFGADSNGSGVAIVLELIRLFSKLYSDPRTHGNYNIVFLLTGGGKFNYQGSKKWLEDQLDNLDGTIIQDASYIMCLDTLLANDAIYMHVSKPPKEGSPTSVFLKELKSIAEASRTAITIEGVHKKINLAEDLLAWEHERFSIRRLPAFTLSALKNHKDHSRGTILDVGENVNLEKLHRVTKIIAETLAAQIYNISATGEIFQNTSDVERSSLDAWITYLYSQPRSAQILSQKDHVLLATIKETFGKYLKDVKYTYVTPDKRDPDFTFYDVTKSVVNIYSVKPAVFDLILTLVIALYLGAIYLFIQKFSFLYTGICNLLEQKHKYS